MPGSDGGRIASPTPAPGMLQPLAPSPRAKRIPAGPKAPHGETLECGEGLIGLAVHQRDGHVGGQTVYQQEGLHGRLSIGSALLKIWITGQQGQADGGHDGWQFGGVGGHDCRQRRQHIPLR